MSNDMKEAGKGVASTAASALATKFWWVALIVIAIFIIVVFMGLLSLVMENERAEQEENESSDGNVSCNLGEVDEAQMDDRLEGAGVFDGEADTFIEAGEENDVDPVLLTAIALHETGDGESSAVQIQNNPGGLMNPDGSGLMSYSSLDEGIEAMADNLYRLYIDDGLVTIEEIGDRYAPIGADNDPTGLNEHWAPTVTTITEDLGGLSMNCDEDDHIDLDDGEMANPVGHMNTTSEFGMRMHPIHGEMRMHNGLDFDCSQDDPIYAAMDGNVVEAEYSGGLGNTVTVEHGSDVHTLYAHLNTFGVSEGDSVDAGDEVGGCGTTGSSTGDHLHFEIHEDGYREGYVDPMDYLGG